MAAVLKMAKNIRILPEKRSNSRILIRNFEGNRDVPVWLKVRNASFEPDRGRGRDWTEDDFHREFTSKTWWNPQHLWFAERADDASVVGTIGLALSADEGNSKGSIVWLAVLPPWRRQKVASLLLSTAERACWEAGCRTLSLETLSSWGSAVAFYRAAGFRESIGEDT